MARSVSIWTQENNDRIYSAYLRLRDFDKESDNKTIAKKISDGLLISTKDGVHKQLRELRKNPRYSKLKPWFYQYSKRANPTGVKRKKNSEVSQPSFDYMVMNTKIEDHPNPVIEDTPITIMSDRLDMLETKVDNHIKETRRDAEDLASLNLKMSKEISEIHELMNGLSDFQDDTNSFIDSSNRVFTILLVANLGLALVSAWMSFQ